MQDGPVRPTFRMNETSGDEVIGKLVKSIFTLFVTWLMFVSAVCTGIWLMKP